MKESESVECLTGRCLCGAIRYRLNGTPFDPGYCHCRMCQLASGAPVMAFATIARTNFLVTSGEPRRRQSSEFGERWFCGNCGTPLTVLVTHQPETLDFTIATLDAPEFLAPAFHIWHGSKIAWFETADPLPRHERFRADTLGMTPRIARGAPLDR